MPSRGRGGRFVRSARRSYRRVRRAASRTRTYARRSYRRARSSGGFGPSVGIGGGRKLRPLEALLWGGGGYVSGGVLDSTGIPSAIYDWSSKYGDARGIPAFIMDRAYQASGGQTTGGKLIVKLAGLGLFGKSAKQAMKSGTTDKMINAELPLALGMMFDGPGDSWGSGAGTSGGGEYW